MIEILKYISDNNYDYEAVGCGFGIAVCIYVYILLVQFLIEVLRKISSYIKTGEFARSKSKQIHNDK